MISRAAARLILCACVGMVPCCWNTASSHAALIAIEDNNVLKSAATTVQGTGNEPSFALKVASTGQANARIGYIKFDLSTIAVNLANEAAFTMTSTAQNTTPYTLQVYALKAGDANYNWAENTITYNNRPAFNNTSNPLLDLTKVTQVGTSISVPSLTNSGTDYTFSFSNLENFRQLDSTLTLIALVSAQTDTGPSFAFASSENPNQAIAPRLTVIPEPTTLGLVLVAALGMGVWLPRGK